MLFCCCKTRGMIHSTSTTSTHSYLVPSCSILFHLVPSCSSCYSSCTGVTLTANRLGLHGLGFQLQRCRVQHHAACDSRASLVTEDCFQSNSCHLPAPVIGSPVVGLLLRHLSRKPRKCTTLWKDIGRLMPHLDFESS